VLRRKERPKETGEKDQLIEITFLSLKMFFGGKTIFILFGSKNLPIIIGISVM
jgi:hypothetical protein